MSASLAARRWRRAVRLCAGSIVWSAGLIVVALAVPVDSSTSVSSDVNGVTLTHTTLVQDDGIRALALLAAPLAASLIVAWALAARRAGARWGAPVAWSAVIVMVAETGLGVLTIGVFILPVTVLLALAVRVAPAGQRADTGGHGAGGLAPES